MGTDLTPRKRAVLAAVVKAYIETGEPIGSKILTELLENAPSSATLRNEMNDLCNLGLLFQPHTSAGRIPTSSGYRLYVNSLMQPLALGESTRKYIDSVFSAAGEEPRSIPQTAGEALSRLTGFPSIVSFMTDGALFVRQVQLHPVGKRSAILLLITSDGYTESRLCHTDCFVSKQLADRFNDIIKNRIIRRSLKELNKAYLQTLIASSGIDSLAIMPILTELFDMAQKAGESQVKICGVTGLFAACGEETAGRILSLAERCDPLLSILNRSKDGTGVIFGNDTGISELSGKAIVVSEYRSGNRKCGKIGIIGQDRMSYDQIIPSIEYIALQLTRFMTRAVNDMEE